MSEQETTADIIAEMRGDGHTGPADALEWVRIKLEYYADRLEAALRREKSAIEADALVVGGIVGASRATDEKSSAVGDCAKLREALCEILSYIESFHKYITPGKGKGKKLTALFAVADTILSKARAALAAPPRNCDKCTSLDEARNAYMAINEMPEGNRDEDMRQWLCDFHHWLFALTKKGGSK